MAHFPMIDCDLCVFVGVITVCDFVMSGVGGVGESIPLRALCNTGSVTVAILID